jgi:hypothetical protein
MIKLVGEQVKELERQIAAAIREHPDGEIFLSLFKRTVITAAELLAEIGDCRARYPTRDALAGDAGQAAVAKESGKRKTATFRWGCDKRLRPAFHTLADSTRHWHPWAQDLYAQAAPAATTTPARCVPSAAPGPASFGNAGETVCRTTRPTTAPCNATSQSSSRGRRAPCPTSLPPSGLQAPLSPHGRAAARPVWADRQTPRAQDRQGRDRPPNPHALLLRAARRRDPLPDQNRQRPRRQRAGQGRMTAASSHQTRAHHHNGARCMLGRARS